jgi:hypothetical protein
MKAFVAYATPLWDEKGHAQVFCDRLFQAFGHEGYHQAGAVLEARVAKKGGRGKKFIDLIWKPTVLIEMKNASEKLHLHYQQVFDYWIAAVPDRPRYVVLCNFKEFWIYDFDKQLDEPVDKVRLDELPYRYTAVNFLFPHNPKPIFNNDREDVSRKAADQMADLYRRLVTRVKQPVPREQAQRFVLQLLVAMFAEDVDLLIAELAKHSRYIVCARVTKRPIFAFVDAAVRPNDMVQVFAFDDDYSFGILQSGVHWEWFTNRCSTLTERFRYTSNTVWDSFPWPQKPTLNAARKVAAAAVEVRAVRAALVEKHKKSLRELYRSMELPGEHPLKAAHAKLDAAVREAFGMTPKQEALPFLLKLNHELAAMEAAGETVQGPGLPPVVKDRKPFVTADAVTA